MTRSGRDGEGTARRVGRLAEAIRVPLILTGALAIVVYGVPALDSSLTPTAVGMMVNLVVVVGLFVFVGNSGVISFGHIAFMALGAYTSALLTTSPQTKHLLLPNLPGFLAHAQFATVPGMIMAGVVAGACGLLVGSALMRLSGIAAGIATFSILVITNTVSDNWTNLTGTNGQLVGVPPTTTRFVALATCAVIMLGAAWYTNSAAGLRLRATREDVPASAALGINVWRERLIAFTLSAICVGVAGALYSGYVGSFDGDAFYIDVTILTLAMLVVGGVRSLTGAFVGAVAITVIEEFFRRLTEGMNLGPFYVNLPTGSAQVALAVAMLVILILRPAGITGGKDVPRLATVMDGTRRLLRLRSEPLSTPEADDGGETPSSSVPMGDPAEAIPSSDRST